MRSVFPHDARLVPQQAECVFKGVIHEVYQWQQKMYDGSYSTYEMLKRHDTVKVIAIVDEKIVVLEQSQPDSPKVFFDTPGGRHDHEEENELEASKRELLEETGLTFATWKLVDCFQPVEKIEQFVYIFVATDLISHGSQQLDNGEKITVHELSYEKTLEICQQSNARYMPKDILTKVGSCDGLKKLKEFSAKEAQKA